MNPSKIFLVQQIFFRAVFYMRYLIKSKTTGAQAVFTFLSCAAVDAAKKHGEDTTFQVMAFHMVSKQF